MVRVGALQYAYQFPKSFAIYAQEVRRLVKEMADQKVQCLLFPEYAGLEMLSFSSLEELSTYSSRYLQLFQELSDQYEMVICSGTHLVLSEGGVRNRSYLFCPGTPYRMQDKCILTPFEREEGIINPGDALHVFDTPMGRCGICICYDVEFPFLVESLVDKGADLILVPSYTNTRQGFHRVFQSCRARALENQCYVVQAALVGQTDIEIAYGAAAILTPIDAGFPEDGVLARGRDDQVEEVIGDLDFQLLAKVRLEGQTHNLRDRRALNYQKISIQELP